MRRKYDDRSSEAALFLYETYEESRRVEEGSIPGTRARSGSAIAELEEDIAVKSFSQTLRGAA